MTYTCHLNHDLIISSTWSQKVGPRHSPSPHSEYDAEKRGQKSTAPHQCGCHHATDGGILMQKNLLRFRTLYFSKSITASGTRATWHMNFQRFHKVCSKCNCPYVTFRINGYLMISDYTAWSTSPVFQIPACATAEIDTAKPSLEGRAVGASQIFRLLPGVRRFPPIHWQPNGTWIQLWFGGSPQKRRQNSKWQTSAFLIRWFLLWHISDWLSWVMKHFSVFRSPYSKRIDWEMLGKWYHP